MADEIELPDGYIDAVWREVHANGVRFMTRTTAKRGSHGECWENAWRYVEARSRYEYVEGVVCTRTGVVRPDYEIRPNVWYPHAWAVKRGRDLRVIECTEGYDLCADAEYIGVPIPREETRIIGKLLTLGAPSASVLELRAAGFTLP